MGSPSFCVAVTLPVVCSVNQAHQKLGEVERRTERLIDQIRPLSMLGETLNRNLSEIRELINQARRQAASVKTNTKQLYRTQMDHRYEMVNLAILSVNV